MSGENHQRTVAEHIRLFNAAVRSGDWATFAAGYTEDARVTFHGVPAPVMHTRQGIADGYRANPPDDTITVLDTTVDGDYIAVRFVWDADPDGAPELIRLRLRGDLVADKHVYVGAEAARA